MNYFDKMKYLHRNAASRRSGKESSTKREKKRKNDGSADS